MALFQCDSVVDEGFLCRSWYAAHASLALTHSCQRLYGRVGQAKVSHPMSVDTSSDESAERRIEQSTDADFGASIVIGALLVIPVLVIVVIVVFMRLRKKRMYKKQLHVRHSLFAFDVFLFCERKCVLLYILCNVRV